MFRNSKQIQIIKTEKQ